MPDNFINGLIGSICKENWTCLSFAGFHMTYSVQFFICPCVFMLFNDLIYIIIDTGTCHDSCLDTPIHRKLVYIIDGFIFLYENITPDHIP